MDTITHTDLLEIVRYDPEDGCFYWLKKQRSRYVTIGAKAGRKNAIRDRIVVWLKGKPYLAHRLAWFYMTGAWPKNEIDHINRNPMDNRFCNLREATRGQNKANTASKNKTGFKGVTYDPSNNKLNPYGAFISKSGKSFRLGSFRTPEEAHQAYRKAAKQEYGEFACFDHDGLI